MKLTIGILEIDILCPWCTHDEFIRDEPKDFYICKFCRTFYAGEWLYNYAPYLPHAVIYNPLTEEMQKGSPPDLGE